MSLYKVQRGARGFSLLEVLIALLIFSLGLLGLAGLMVVSVKTNQSAYLRTQASFVGQALADRMRANIGQIDAYEGDYDSSTAADPVDDDPCRAASCSPADLATRDRAVWSRQLVDSLPAATANVDCNGALVGAVPVPGASTYDGLCTMTIQWNEAGLDRVADADLASNLNTQTFAWVFQP